LLTDLECTRSRRDRPAPRNSDSLRDTLGPTSRRGASWSYSLASRQFTFLEFWAAGSVDSFPIVPPSTAGGQAGQSPRLCLSRPWLLLCDMNAGAGVGLRAISRKDSSKKSRSSRQV